MNASKFILFYLLCGMATPSVALEITMPPETSTYRRSDLRGYLLVQKNCIACHSEHYVRIQPSDSPRHYWEATVRKMQKTFGAPIADEDIAPMVDYLVKLYGNERSTIKNKRVQSTPKSASD